METENSKKQYETRHRFRWAARYPLKPGRDVASRRALLLLIAETSITGEYWMSQETLAERMGMTARGVRKILAKLCAEGALRAQHRGYRQTNIYTLMRLGEVAQYGDFLPLSDRNSSSSHHGMTGTTVPPMTGTTVPPMTGTTVPPKEAIREEDIRQERAAAAETPTSVDSATAAGFADLAAAASQNSSMNPKNPTERHACPKCERTWPKHFGAVCFNCQHDVDRARRREEEWAKQEKEGGYSLLGPEVEEAPPALPAPPPPPGSKTTRRLRAAARTESWLNHQGLDQLIGNRDLEEVCELMYAMGGGRCEPEDFFEDYDRHLQEHKRAEAAYLAPFPQPANNGTSQGGLVPIGEVLAARLEA